MGGPGEPPDGTPDGAAGGNEEEYRSVVFDESFVKAARLQEYSAQERLADHAPPVRPRPSGIRRLSRQALVLALLVMIAFVTAVYLGVRNPDLPSVGERHVDPVRVSVVPLAPQQAVPGAADPDRLYAASPARGFESGEKGVTMPPARRTEHFTDGQVIAALAAARDYVIGSSLDPKVLMGDATRSVRVLLDPDQFDQFDRSLGETTGGAAADGDRATADEATAPLGWMVRFDPTRVRLADPDVRVRGTFHVAERNAATLEVVADHVFVYALTGAGEGKPEQAGEGDKDKDRVSLFTVRREVRMRFDQDNLRLRQVRVVSASVQAGPLSCTGDPDQVLRPLLAGQRAGDAVPPGTDPYRAASPTGLCGTLSPAAMPRL
ncbi:SCO2583 family membrane protein [Streptomyces sp. NPDC002640]